MLLALGACAASGNKDTSDTPDPRFAGWYVFTCSAKADDKPSIVDLNRMPIVDPSKVYSGMVAYVSAGISYYGKGKCGIGGWLNGVLLADEEPPMGRLDNKPSVEQMFASVPGGAAPAQQPVGAAAPMPGKLLMTPLANGVTYEQYMQTPGWTDQMLIDQGLATRPIVAQQPAPQQPAPQQPAPQQPAPQQPVALVMTALANGVTYQQYMQTTGWTDQMLIDQGLAIQPSFA